MTALNQDRDPRRKEGLLGQGPVGANVTIYGGALVMFNAKGYVIPGADTAGCIFAGVSAEQTENSLGANGDKTAEFWREGLFMVTLGSTISQANVGDKVYIVDDQTVGLTVTNVYCGVIAEYLDSTHAWIDIKPATV